MKTYKKINPNQVEETDTEERKQILSLKDIQGRIDAIDLAIQNFQNEKKELEKLLH